MKNALILHGTDASPADNWFGWLQKELETIGYNVWLPQLPHADKPSTKIYSEFLLANKEFEFTSETILIGHSSGAVEALSLLEYVENPIKSAFMVSAFKDSLGWEALEDLFITPLNFEKIKDKAENFIFVHSDNDPYCPIDHAEFLAEQVDGELFIKSGQGHFNTELGSQYEKFPELLELIQQY